MIHIAALGLATVWICLVVQLANGQANFQGLGDLPGGGSFSTANAVSGDGTVIVGTSSSANGSEAFRCIQQSGGFTMISLGDLPGGFFHSQAHAVNVDGTVVVGFSSSSAGGEGFRWTASGGMVGLGALPSTLGPGSEAFDVSGDGSVIVGQSFTPQTCDKVTVNTSQAVQWLDNIAALQNMPGDTMSKAFCVSHDGSVIGGSSSFSSPCGSVFTRGVLWTNGAVAAITAPHGFVNDLSPDGQVAIGQNDGSGFMWRAGSGLVQIPDMLVPRGVSANGSRVIGQGPTGAVIWDEGLGTRNLKSVLLNDYGLAQVASWNLTIAWDISDDGTVIVGQGINPSGQPEAWVAHIPSLDIDGDGLLDDWEINGIPYTDINGDEKRYILDVDGDRKSDADPNHKDLFVELDMMAGLTFPQSAVDAVVFAFETAPLMNPDGTEGITLHIVVDDTTLPFEVVTQTPNGGWPTTAPQVKADWLGTSAERSDASSAALLDAKSQAYRYGIQMNKASESIGGLGEMPGDDFILFSGTYPDIDKAAVFMHELGHTLGLDHGGVDDLNGKPNYPSIMNYVLAYKEPWSASFWRLDFSRAQLPTLDENSLDESAPVGNAFYHNFFMPYYSVVAAGAPCYNPILYGQPLVSYVELNSSASTDYNLDCDVSDDALTGDLNFLNGSALPGSLSPSPGELLIGWNDWDNLLLAVTNGGGAFAGPVPQDELNEFQRAFMERTFPIPPGACLADINDSGSTDVVDLLLVINSWGACSNIANCPADIAPNSGVGDGQVNVADLLAVINAWGACE